MSIPYYHPLNQWLLGATNGNQGYTVMDLRAHLCTPPHSSAQDSDWLRVTTT